MTEPLALVLYEKLLPGSQLVNRLQDLKYRVQSITDPELLVECAQQAKPLVVLADLEPNREKVCAAISKLRQHPATQHLPVVAYSHEDTPEEAYAAAKTAGVTLCVTDTAILNHLPQLLNQALQLD